MQIRKAALIAALIAAMAAPQVQAQPGVLEGRHLRLPDSSDTITGGGEDEKTEGMCALRQAEIAAGRGGSSD